MTYLSTRDYWTEYAIKEISSTYSDTVAVKNKTLLKFGAIDSLGTSEEMIWQQGGIETLIATNAIDTVSSSDAGDTQDVTIEGHTISGSDLTFVTQSATLNGQTKVVLTTALARASRIYNNGNTDFAGNIYVYEDDTITAGVPQTAAKVHLKTARNQSLKAATSISSVDYYLITNFHGSVNKKTTGIVDFRLQIRRSGKVFRDVVLGSSASTGGNLDLEFKPYIIAPKNSDIRITGTGSTTNIAASAWINGLLSLIQ